MTKKVLIHLDEETDALLRAEAARTGQSLSEYVRRAIKARAGEQAAKAWLNIETRNEEAGGDVVKEIKDALQNWHNRGGK